GGAAISTFNAVVSTRISVRYGSSGSECDRAHTASHGAGGAGRWLISEGVGAAIWQGNAADQVHVRRRAILTNAGAAECSLDRHRSVIHGHRSRGSRGGCISEDHGRRGRTTSNTQRRHV